MAKMEEKKVIKNIIFACNLILFYRSYYYNVQLFTLTNLLKYRYLQLANSCKCLVNQLVINYTNSKLTICLKVAVQHARRLIISYISSDFLEFY